MRCDLAVVGGGILGLAHAVAGIRRGLRVAIVDRNVRPRGASVRNFGMIWPIGQPRGRLRATAERSAQIWGELAAEADFRCGQPGSLHVAYHEDEWATLREYHAGAGETEGLELWTPEDCLRGASNTVGEGLLGGLFSPTERSVDPPAAVMAIQAWLLGQGCTLHAPDVAVEVGTGFVRTSAGRRIEAEQIAVCSGADFETLAPDLFREEWTKCRLQMMSTVPLSGFELGPMRAAGLTLIHYRSFSACPSLSLVRQRVERDFARHLAHGVHVLVAQHADGSLVLGDSHEYGREFDPYHREDVDALILGYLRSFFELRGAAIARRWAGVYSVRKDWVDGCFTFPIADRVDVVNGVGGMGMTLSFGLGEQHVGRWFSGS